MPGSILVAPSLSTVQTSEEFSFEICTGASPLRAHLRQHQTKMDLANEIIEYYSVPQLIEYFNEHQEYKNITLQFPDELVVDSAIIAEKLQNGLVNESIMNKDIGDLESNASCRETTCCDKNTPQSEKISSNSQRRVWILADTSYSPCCVDEVASEHVKGDIVVHFGDACLNEVAKLPVLYSFGKPKLDFDKLVSKFIEKYPHKDVRVCLMTNAPYSYHLEKIYSYLLGQGYRNLLFADINSSELKGSTNIIGYTPLEVRKPILHLGNRSIYGNADDISNDEDLRNEYELFHISKPQDPHLLYLTTKFQAVTLYEPSTTSLVEGPFPSMMKRYRFMHIARTAGTIGILVNTLSLRNTKEAINKLIKLIRQNGKKHYLFVVGKPNVAKLANFEAIDVWCILGCGQGGIILDQTNEFYKPIVTPYELITALNIDLSWTGKWIVDFKSVLNEMEDDDGSENSNFDDSTQNSLSANNAHDDAPEFDPVTGKYISTSRPLRNVTRLEIEDPSEEIISADSSNLLVKQFSGSVSIRNTVSTSASFLQKRQWTGLGSDYQNGEENHQADGAIVEDGISGIARGYDVDLPNVTSQN